ncbi:hypothetical protein [Gordonia soli]|uniref:HTH cro/C1-type domain-containing protein n=1 Tax=Gordonia soli NBRC 108243 TaxID=1223545 RepID=M0QIG3_9ACTN|nr:hypothetical protein [Gordonia soli]GAC68244.1 hypothetical protein GS4_14_00750 [Gordonia soli NBRC 108243]
MDSSRGANPMDQSFFASRVNALFAGNTTIDSADVISAANDLGHVVSAEEIAEIRSGECADPSFAAVAAIAAAFRVSLTYFTASTDLDSSLFSSIAN